MKSAGVIYLDWRWWKKMNGLPTFLLNYPCLYIAMKYFLLVFSFKTSCLREVGGELGKLSLKTVFINWKMVWKKIYVWWKCSLVIIHMGRIFLELKSFWRKESHKYTNCFILIFNSIQKCYRELNTKSIDFWKPHLNFIIVGIFIETCSINDWFISMLFCWTHV